jgi:predicted Zn-dependent protease
MTIQPLQTRRLLRRLIVPLIGLVSLLGTGCTTTDKAVIGQANQFHQNLEPAVMEDPQLSRYIQQVGDRIIAAAEAMDKEGFGPKSHKKESATWMFDKGGMKFHFVNSKTLNAFTTGGNHMYIYSELFEQCKTEDELAAVMSHEFAHVYARHVQQGMDRQMVTMAGAAGAGLAGYAAGGKQHGQQYGGMAAGLAAAAGQYFGMSFTREDEDEADRLGFQFYVRAGWDPNKFDDFFQTMIDKGYDKTPETMSDHPSLKSRVQKAQQRVKNLGDKASRFRQPEVASAAEFRQLQERAISVGKSMPTDQSLAQSKELLQALPRSCLTPRDQVALPDQRAAQMDLLQYLQGQQAVQASSRHRR